MAFCNGCGMYVSDALPDCPECGHRLKKKERPHFDSQAQKQNWMDERMRVAEFERRKFNLSPQRSDEKDYDYCVRIDREKTPLLFKPREREPGSDDNLGE